MAGIAGKRTVVEPGEPAGDLAERLGLLRPEQQRAFRAPLERVVALAREHGVRALVSRCCPTSTSRAPRPPAG